jgi:predicted CxxxxCH...CXXCH cytochrome family protein
MDRSAICRLLPMSLALLLAACGSSRAVVEGGELTHAATFKEPAAHGAAAKAGLSTCKTCHGADLEGALGPSCATCHAAAGYANWSSNCTFCHGSERVQVYDATQLAKAAPATGAHAQHVNAGIFSKALACQNCHPAVTSLDHVNGTVEVAFGAIGGAGGATGTYTAATGTCSNVYCHGGTLEGAARPEVTWATGGASLLCGDCHTISPTSGGTNGHTFHVTGKGAACLQCHRGYGNIDLENHVSGTSEAVLPDGTKFTAFEPNCTACHTKLGI